MGEFDPEVTDKSLIQGPQGEAMRMVTETLRGLIGEGGGELFGARGAALGDILGGAPTDISGIENAMLRRYDEQIAPRIDAGAAGIGGTLSSRVAETKRQALGDVQSQIGAFQTQLMEGARNRQLAAAQQVLGPLQIGAGFSTPQTQENIVSPSSMMAGFRGGSEMFGQAVSMGSMMGGK